MNVASLELCKELYELSGWDGTHIFYDAENDPVESKRALIMHPTKNCPAYELGYLLRKLPTDIEEAQFVNVGTADEKEPWVAEYSPSLTVKTIYAFADTPEDAACKLAIKLFKNGILSQEKES